MKNFLSAVVHYGSEKETEKSMYIQHLVAEKFEGLGMDIGVTL